MKITNVRKFTINLLFLGILLLITATASAAPNWQFMNEENSSKYYIDTNSIVSKGESVFYNTKEVYPPGTSDWAYQILTMEYIPNKGIMRYYWEKDYDAIGRLTQSVSTAAQNPFAPVSPEYTEIQIVNKILAEKRNNSQQSQQVGESSRSNSPSNTVTNFPQEMGSMHLVLSQQIKQGIYSEEKDFLDGQSGVRCVVVAKPSSYDGGSLKFKLDNGKYVGIWLNPVDGKIYFEGDDCQPRQIEGGILTRYKDEYGFFGKVRFNGVSINVLGDGKLGIAFYSPNNNKTFTVALPTGAHYLTGIISVRGIDAEVAFYK